MLAPKPSLAATELAFYIPAFLSSAFILHKQGFARQQGWFYLLALSILRLIGAACTLYMATQNDFSASLLETAIITSAVGTAPLLLALLGFQERVNEGMEHKGLSPDVFRPIHLIALTALVISIVGGVYETHASASDQRTGKKLMEAAGVLFLTIYLALCGSAIRALVELRWVLVDEKRLAHACVVALPFLCVRIVYTLCVVFGTRGSMFDLRNVNVWVQAFMQFLMEVVVVAIFVLAGVTTPKHVKREMQEGAVKEEAGDEGVELGETVGQG